MANNNPTNPNTLAPVPTPDQFRNDALLPIANASGMTPAQMSASAQSLSSQNVLNVPKNQVVAVGPGNVQPTQTPTQSWGRTGIYKEGGKDVYQEQTWNPSSGKFESVTFDNTTGNRAGTPIPVPPGRSTITGDAGASAAADLSLSISSREADLNNERLNQVNALRAAQMEEEKVIRDTFNARRATLSDQQNEQDKSQDVLAYRLGRKDTPYGVAEMANLQNDQARVMNELAVEESSLIQKSKQALAKGEYQASLDMRDEADRMLQRRIQTEQLNFQKQSQIREEKKFVQEQGKDVFNALALAGKEPSQELYDWYDSTIGVSGVGQGIYQAASAEKARLEIKDAREAQKADMDAASSLVTVLQKIPIGESITIGDNTYTGMERGKVQTGTETDAQGNVTFWEFDETTKGVKKTSLGNIGKPQDGWATVQTDQGTFSYNAKTKQYVPLNPGVAQSTWQEAFPDGSKSPFRAADDPSNGQCGALLNDLYGQKLLGDSFEQKKSVLSKYEVSKEDVQVGDSFLMSSGTTGHVGIVSNVTDAPDGKKVLTFLESNYIPPNGGVISTTRTMNADDARLKMFARVPTPNLPPAGTDAATTTPKAGGLTIGGKPIAQVFGDTTNIENYVSGYMNGQLKIDNIPMDLRGDVVAAATARGYTGKPVEPTIDIIQPRKFEDFAKEYENSVAQDPNRTSLRPNEVQEAYKQDTDFRNSVKQTFDAIKRGKMTKIEKEEFVAQAQEALQNNDIDTVENIATQVALKGMSQTQQDAYQSSLNLVDSYKSGMDLLGSFADDEGFVKDSGSIRSIIESKKKQFGLNVDTRYMQLEQLLGSFQNEYRNNLFGASLTPQEMVEANKVIANVAESTPRDLWDKMNQGAQIQQFAADVRVATTLGMPRPKLADYLK